MCFYSFLEILFWFWIAFSVAIDVRFRFIHAQQKQIQLMMRFAGEKCFFPFETLKNVNHCQIQKYSPWNSFPSDRFNSNINRLSFLVKTNCMTTIVLLIPLIFAEILISSLKNRFLILFFWINLQFILRIWIVGSISCKWRSH